MEMGKDLEAGESYSEYEDEEYFEDENGDDRENYFSRVLELEKEKSRLLTVLAVVFVLFIAGLSYYQVYLKDDDDDITIIGFDYERAYIDGQYLVKEGPRLAGTPNEHRAAEYIAQEFKKAGLSNVHIENYTMELYEVNDAYMSLEAYSRENGLVDKEYRHLYDFAVMGYSGSTNGEEAFDIVFVGNGTEEAYAQADDVSGSVALVRTDGSHTYTELYIQAMNHSASASVIYGDRAKPISRTSAVPDDDREGVKPISEEYDHNQLIPHLMVSPSVGDELRSWSENSTSIEERCKLNLDIDVTIEDRVTMVVVGDIRGTDKPEELVIMGAHHDTVYTGEGGADNTVGACGIIETARQLANYKPKRTIRMLTFGAEEEGLFGSKEYVLNHTEEIETNTVFMTNLDMTCLNVTEDGKNNSFPIRVNTEKHQKDVRKVADEFFKRNSEIAEKYTYSTGVTQNAPYSDYYHFALHGSDFAACWGQNAPGYHNPGDQLKYTNPESWQLAGGIMGSYSLYLANK